MSTNSEADIVDAQTKREPTEAEKFWGPLIHIVSIFELLIKSHILIAALLFPVAWIKDEEESDSGLSYSYRLWCLIFGLVVLVLNILGIGTVIALLVRGQLIEFAKAYFVLLAWFVSIVALIVVNQQKHINALLFAIEDEATQSRDESVMLIRAGQAGIRSLNTRLYGEQSPSQFFTASELLKSIGPLALLFMNKERNLLKWGMVGANAAVKGIRFVNNLLHKK